VQLWLHPEEGGHGRGERIIRRYRLKQKLGLFKTGDDQPKRQLIIFGIQNRRKSETHLTPGATIVWAGRDRMGKVS
jgi:hypothetical protein